jgi:hypothetical protein
MHLARTGGGERLRGAGEVRPVLAMSSTTRQAWPRTSPRTWSGAATSGPVRAFATTASGAPSAPA